VRLAEPVDEPWYAFVSATMPILSGSRAGGCTRARSG
jgi:hypothetical protein